MYELGSATDIYRLLVSSGLSTPIFTLIGNDDSWSCKTDVFVGQKCLQKLITLSSLGYLGEFESDSPTVWTAYYVLGTNALRVLRHGQRFKFPSPKFAVVDEIRLPEAVSAFWLAQLVRALTAVCGM